MRNLWLRRWCGMASAAAIAFCLDASIATAADKTSPSLSGNFEWPMFGQNFNNTAEGRSFSIDKHTVSRLKPKWIFNTSGDVSARPSVVGGAVYFPDWGGHVYRLNAATGAMVWSKSLTADYGLAPAFGQATVVSRTTPAVDGNTIYIGSQFTTNGAQLLAINKSNGALRWKIQLDPHPYSVHTSSAIVFRGVIYLGVSSLEEGPAEQADYPCCSFRGSIMAINAATGAVIWKTYTVPPGYSGAAMWGSSVVPDPVRGQVYATTSNQYTTPKDPAFVACVAGMATEDKITSCLSPDDHFDSVLALDMKTGSVRWSHRLATADDWNGACLILAEGQENCPSPEGVDADFGSGANFFTVQTPKGPRQIVGAGEKNGIYAAFDPDTGKLLWATQVGPGSVAGGVMWGSATDGQRVYVANGNFAALPSPVGGTGGNWTALDALTGKILWQKADPNGALDWSPLTVANGVVYGGSMSNTPGANTMIAMDASTGATLWSFPAGGPVIAGAAIVGDTIYWGSGYVNLVFPGFTGTNKFYAFSLDGK
jgi:polyvinyl alcohol dehydrogenase (cytochrome)